MKGFHFVDYMSQKNQRKNIAHIMNCTNNKRKAFNPRKEQYNHIARNRIILLLIVSSIIITGLLSFYL